MIYIERMKSFIKIIQELRPFWYQIYKQGPVDSYRKPKQFYRKSFCSPSLCGTDALPVRLFWFPQWISDCRPSLLWRQRHRVLVSDIQNICRHFCRCSEDWCSSEWSRWRMSLFFLFLFSSMIAALFLWMLPLPPWMKKWIHIWHLSNIHRSPLNFGPSFPKFIRVLIWLKKKIPPLVSVHPVHPKW